MVILFSRKLVLKLFEVLFLISLLTVSLIESVNAQPACRVNDLFVPIIIDDLATFVPIKPDYMLTQVSGPSSGASPSQNVPVSVTIKNEGTRTTNFSWVSIYLSTDSVITGSDRFLNKVDAGPLSRGEVRTINVPVTLTGDITTGTYFLGAIADPDNCYIETAEGNNILTGNAIQVSQTPNIDLIITSITSLTASPTASQSITLSVTVKNQGTTNSTGPTVGIYISPFPQFAQNSAISLGNWSAPALAAGQSVTNNNLTYHLPVGMRGGPNYLTAIADYQTLIGETNESNNRLTPQTPITVRDVADVYFSGISYTSSARPGGEVKVTVTVCNQGWIDFINQVVPVDFYIKVGDTYNPFGDETVSDLGGAGGSVALCKTTPEHSFILPSNFETGNHSIVAFINEGDAVNTNEINTSNNVISRPFFVCLNSC